MIDGNPFSPTEIARLRKLLEVEAIREVRKNYSTYLDTLQVDKLADPVSYTHLTLPTIYSV